MSTSATSVVQQCEPTDELHAIEVVTLGDDDRPIAGLAIACEWGSKGVQTDVTDARGRCRFDGIEPGGEARITIVDLDAAAWELVTALPLSPAATVSRVSPTWSASRPTAAPARTIQSARGECLVRLGYRHGFLPQTLWDHNGARWGPRHAKDVLTPGTALELPARSLRWVDVSAGQLAVVHRIGLPVLMTLRVVDAQARPWAGCPYVLRFEGSARPIATQVGRTDRAGRLHAPVLPDVTKGVLVVEPRSGERRWTFELAIGELRPADEPEGAAARLWNMGFRGGGNPLWREGEVLATFQREALASEPTPLDDAAASSLVDWHGS